MTDLNKIIAGAKAIEKILTEQFGGTGRGMTEKLNSARYPIPEALQKRVKHLAWLRNKSVHEEGFMIGDADDYAAKCAAACEDLKRAHIVGVELAQAQATKRGSSTKLVLAAVAVLAAVWWFLTPSRTKAPEAGPAPAEALASAPGFKASAPRAAAAAAASSPVRAQRRTAGRAPESAASAALAPSNGNIGLGNDVLTVDAVHFAFRNGSFNTREPELKVKVSNTSDRTISSAIVQARLYINGEGMPAIDSASGTDKANLYLFFGEQGLAAGASTTANVSFGFARWNVPDVLNASSRQVVLRIVSASDGRRQAFGGKARPWPIIDGKQARLPVAQVAQVAPEVRQAFREGGHVALGDANLELGNVRLSLVKGSFGSMEPRIEIAATNRSPVTMGMASFEVKLFINGESEPMIDSQERVGSDRFHAYFGESGLSSGASRNVQLSAGLHAGSMWSAPDIAKAIRKGRTQLVLSLVSFTDGRSQHHKVSIPGAGLL